MKEEESGNQLAELRDEVSRINEAILSLLNRRCEVTDRIRAVKSARGLPMYDPMREADQMSRLVKGNPGPMDVQSLERVFLEIFRASLDRMEREHQAQRHQGHKTAAGVVHVAGVPIGGAAPILIAGPCSVESEEYLEEVALALVELGVPLLRGGVFKPRTSPLAFQGLGLTGLTLLERTGKRHGLGVVSELTDAGYLDEFAQRVDMVQVGARNMFNYDLLDKLARCGKPVFLKRSFGARVEELLDSAEYLLRGGNPQVVLCERGIRTFETSTRATLDLSAVAWLKTRTPLPVAVDVSHAAGRTDLLLPLAKASIAAGADAIMVEVHPYPAAALSDGSQQMDLNAFRAFHEGLKPMLRSVG